MGKRISIFLAAVMLLSFFGCASSESYPGEVLQGEATSAPTPVSTETGAENLPAEATQATEASTESIEDSHPTEATESTKITEATESTQVTEAVESTQPTGAAQTYILNTNTRKFHYPDCSSAKRIKDNNRKEYYGTREEIIQMGYDPCKNCNP